jgi:hypothetical protein
MKTKTYRIDDLATFIGENNEKLQELYAEYLEWDTSDNPESFEFACAQVWTADNEFKTSAAFKDILWELPIELEDLSDIIGDI